MSKAQSKLSKGKQNQTKACQLGDMATRLSGPFSVPKQDDDLHSSQRSKL
jgi:hypothetical protein